MVEITGSKDCGNSPKNTLVERVAVALETGDQAFLGEYLAEGAVWETSDGRMVEGDGIVGVASERAATVASVSIDHVISHGKIGSANGTCRDSRGRQAHFCHVVEFSNVKFTRIRRICSYRRL